MNNVPPEYLKNLGPPQPQPIQLSFAELLSIYQALITIPGEPSPNRRASIDKLELFIRNFTDSLNIGPTQ